MSRCEICLNEFHGPYEDHYAWDYTETSLKIRNGVLGESGFRSEASGDRVFRNEENKVIELSVCVGCFNISIAKLKMNVPVNKHLFAYDEQRDLLRIFQNLDKLKVYAKETGKSLKYGILRENVERLRFDLYSKESVKWITEKDTEKEHIYCEIFLMWKETGEIVVIKDRGRMKHLRENVQFQELMKNNEGKEFLLMNESIYLLHKLLYDRKNITDQWYGSIDELTNEVYSGVFYSEMRKDAELIMTEEFRNHYRNIQKELLSKIRINLLDNF